MSTDDKRFYRKLKKLVKRAGTKKVRRDLKQRLEENPDSAHDDPLDYGRAESASMNGNDGRNRKRASDDQ